MFWHCRNIERMAFDHFIHRHELYVGTEHGIDKIRPTVVRALAQGTWPYIDNPVLDVRSPASARLPRVQRDEAGSNTQMMGDWRGLAIGPDG